MTAGEFLLLIHGAAASIAGVHIILRKREPSAAVMWLFMVGTLPVLGVLFYVIFGVNLYDRRVTRKVKANFRVRRALAERAKRGAADELQAADDRYRVLARCHDLLVRLEQRPPVSGNSIEMLVGGTATYRALFAAIRQARDHIHIQVYILAGDEFGRDLLNVLAERAAQGIEVRVLYDAVGSIGIPRRFLNDLERAGIRVEAFGRMNPIRRGFQINFRNHRKNIIIDGKIGFTGGINLHAENSRRYCRQPHHLHERLIRDYHFRAEGPIVAQLQEVFVEDWFYASGEMLTSERYFRVSDTQDRGTVIARVLTSGPGDDSEVIAKTLFAAITSAQREILIVTPYFYPTPAILEAIANAALAGIDVHLIVPVTSDHRFVTWAGQSLFPFLVKNGVKVHRRRLPFIHSKAVLIDRSWAFVGSANLDYRSLLLNFELNLEVVDQEFAERLGRTLDGEIAESSLVRAEELKRLPTVVRFRNNFCALFAPVL